MISKIKFERLGANTKKDPIVIMGNDLYEITKVIEIEAEKEGINPALLDFRWNANGDGKHYLVRAGMNSIIGAFTITDVSGK